MNIQEEREAFEIEFSKIKSDISFWVNTWDEDMQGYNHPVMCWIWHIWQAAKAKAVPEPVLDAPACVGAGTFQKGVKWSTVIGAAQRHFKYTQNAKKAPSLDIVQVKKLVSGDFVLMPKVATKKMVNAGYEAHDGFFTNGQVQDVYQAMIEAQEPADD